MRERGGIGIYGVPTPPRGGWRGPSPSLVISVIALFVALSGSALALSRGEVKSKNIAKGAVKSKQIAKGAVKSKQVAKGAVKAKNVKASQVQLRLQGQCSAGQAIRVIEESGGLTCEAVGGPPSGGAGGALSGTYPNPGIAPGAVGSDELAVGAVTGARIAPGAVGTDAIGAGTVTNAKLGSSAVDASKLNSGAVTNAKLGSQAVNAAKLAPGAVTASKLGPIVFRTASSVTPGTGSGALTANCAAGEVVIGGGSRWTTGSNNWDVDSHIVSSYPTSATSWFVRASNMSGFERTLEVYALCLDG